MDDRTVCFHGLFFKRQNKTVGEHLKAGKNDNEQYYSRSDRACRVRRLRDVGQFLSAFGGDKGKQKNSDRRRKAGRRNGTKE